ncbi:MAG: hypothetical protein HWN81_20405 [Candidatus Lokiarchaeota archaeon]|nr:hypothetical protein [Candidatus Lokiarchaeota archaeon]
MTEKTFVFSEEEVKLLMDAAWTRQRCFIAGDRMFKSYGTILSKLEEDSSYVPERYR